MSSFGFQFVPKGVKVFSELRTPEKEVIDSSTPCLQTKQAATSVLVSQGIPPLRPKLPMILACEHALSSCQSSFSFIFSLSYIDNH